MKNRYLLIAFLLVLLLSMGNCAKKGSPSGGAKDTIPPVILRSEPENFSTNFDREEIRIYFDEYIKLKDLQKNLVISPPLKYTPVITPLNTSKMIKITIMDTLMDQTTYSINFGQSIVDNNEENTYSYFKYIFSTGHYIDSLRVSGRVNDALTGTPKEPVTVMLYEWNEAYADSVVFQQKPLYITTTTEGSGAFELSNLKEGRYRLVALQESTPDYIFQPEKDKIGFVSAPIVLPTDSTYTLDLFREIPDYQSARPAHQSKHEILFGYKGDGDSLEIQMLTEKPDDFRAITYRDLKKDTLHYWYRPAFERDTVDFLLRNRNIRDTVPVRIRELYADTLNIQLVGKNTRVPGDTIRLLSNTPLVSLNSDRIQLMDRDSLQLPFTAKLNPRYNLAEIYFNKVENQAYSMQLLPGALTDFFEKTHDTLSFRFRTQPESDYGTLSLTVNNVPQYPIITQLTDGNFQVVAEQLSDKKEGVYFDHITPGLYYLRIIIDENGNGKWDPGNFLQGKQPEPVIFYPDRLEVRANWSLNETFTLD